jgi:hypothetical protein
LRPIGSEPAKKLSATVASEALGERFPKSVILRINEARDLGDADRYQLYEHLKPYTASPPDVLLVDEKNLREYRVLNCTGVIITTNNQDSLYLPADDRRYYVAWSPVTKEDFTEEYWKTLWRWYDEGGDRQVAAYLAELDLSNFNPKAAPPKTAAFWQIVSLNRAPENYELADALDKLGNPDATTIAKICDAADPVFSNWLGDRKNNRLIPHRLSECGYVSVENSGPKDGRWVIAGDRHVIYAKKELSTRDRHLAAAALVKKEEAAKAAVAEKEAAAREAREARMAAWVASASTAAKATKATKAAKATKAKATKA